MNRWEFAKLLVPLLYGGVFVVGSVSVLLPEKQVAQWVGDNSIGANLVASVIVAFWYFATLTEIPITQALSFAQHSRCRMPQACPVVVHAGYLLRRPLQA